ncbi:MAG: hypothetical protein HY658_02530 [Actinobacteria bacterium]|nr:hypothetical protein [Actinomycetota bacterium]
MAERPRFDHVVVNDDLFRAADEILAMIDAYRRGDTPPRSVREGTPEP